LIDSIIKDGIKKSECKSNLNSSLIASVTKAMMQDWYLKRWKYKRRNIIPEEYALECFNIIYNYIHQG